MTITAAPSGYNARTPTDLLIDIGILSYDVAAVDTVLGVSRGGLQFDPGITIKELEYDGRRSPIVGGDRISYRKPTISGSMLQLGPEDWRLFEAGAGGTGSTPGTVVPKLAGLSLVIGEYVKNLTLTFTRSGGGTGKVKFPYALCTKYGPVGGKDNDEAEIPVTFEARLDRADVANVDGTVPYVITLLD
jgi:hypothetical protein